MLLLKKIINKILGFLGYKISKISVKKKKTRFRLHHSNIY